MRGTVKYPIFFLAAISIMAFSHAVFYQPEIPAHFPSPEYNYQNNPLSIATIQLGRTLFYDPILSLDNSISCASCHSPYNAFAHSDHDLSHGINDQIGTRNAPGLFNLGWQKSFMWDGAINHLDVQALAPLTHSKEMAEDLNNVIGKLQRQPIYNSLFFKAYGDSLITGQHLLKALSQFQLTLISGKSKYDQVQKGTATFSEQELEGYNLFKANCNSCHKEPMFSNYTFENNGLPIDSTLNDFGRWMITKKTVDSLKFKTPSLRNLSYTSPYMHDGRFKKLNEVLSHYVNGAQNNITTSSSLINVKNLSSNEKTDIIAFLLTLNDSEFVFNPENKFPKNNAK